MTIEPKEFEHNQLEFRDRLLDCSNTQTAHHLQSWTLPDRMVIYRVRSLLIQEMNNEIARGR